MSSSDAYLLPHRGEPILLDPARELVLGRGESADITTNNTMVSRRHCLLSCDDGACWLLRDCGSRNGVLINGSRVVDHQQLVDRDIINVAGEQWTFVIVAAGAQPAEVQPGNQRLITETMELDEGLHAHGLDPALARELDQASEIQRKMMIAPPQISGWDIATHTEGLTQLSGDFYDVAEVADGRVQLLLGDVCGHGVHAALFGTTILKANRLLRDDLTRSRDLLTRLNNEACKDSIAGHFATLFVAYLHPPSGQLEAILLGHHAAFVYRAASNTVERVGERGLAVGITESTAFELGIRPATCHLARGDILLQVTDGYIESENADGIALDDAGIETWLATHHDMPDMATLCTRLNHDLHQHCATVQDDLTLLALRCNTDPDPTNEPDPQTPSALQLDQQSRRRIAYYLCQSAHQYHRLSPPQRYLIGRSAEADIRVVDSHVSRRHCLVIWDDEKAWLLKDLGSRNGLIINGTPCAEDTAPLRDGDRLQVGPEEYTYRVVPMGVDLAALLRQNDDDAVMATLEAEPDKRPRPAAHLSGATDGLGLIDLLQYCRMCQRSGRLVLHGSQPGTIWLCDGLPVHAECGETQGAEAIAQLVIKSCESFELFAEDAPAPAQTIKGAFDDLLMNLALHIDEAQLRVPTTGLDLDTAPPSEPRLPVSPINERKAGASTTVSDPDHPQRRPGSSTETISQNAHLGKLAGTQLGQVKLGVCIGRGANAEVYQGQHLLLDIEVAVKILMGERDEIGEKARGRLLSEARLAAKVRHPRVIQVIDAGVGENGELFLVEEFVNGTDLGHRLNGNQGLSVPEILRYARGIAEGLSAIHAQGILHRDIKPDNILIDQQGEVHISDLGLARNISDGTVHRLTRTGAVLGTPAYVSPEAIQDSKHIGLESDIYSFGATLYHLLAGRPPFTGHSAYEVMQRHLQGKPSPVTKHAPHTPPALARLTMRCLHLDPAKRPNAADIVVQLADIPGGSTVRSVHSLRQSRPGGRWWLLILLGLLALLLAAWYLPVWHVA